jgi:hypothetical protein
VRKVARGKRRAQPLESDTKNTRALKVREEFTKRTAHHIECHSALRSQDTLVENSDADDASLG